MATVLIPGIKGSELADSYPLDWPVRWSLEDMVFGDAFENPLDFALLDGRFEANDGHRMLPSRPIRFAYGEMVGKLRAWKPAESLHVFTYDWRRPIEHAAQKLVEFCEELQGRQARLKRSTSLNFITHSMGGLVLRSMLALRNRKDPFAEVGRVVFIAPPFRGSVAATQMLVAGERDGWFGTDEDYRKIARSFPSVYQMTPHFGGCTVDENGAAVDLFDAANWQANVRDGSGGFDARFVADAEAFFGRKSKRGGTSPAPILDDAALAANVENILILQGTGVPTPYQLTVQRANMSNPNWFDFAGAQKDVYGDGRVHLRSSAVAGVTLAGFAGAADHGRVCRDTRVINTVSLWLEGKRALKMQPRAPEHPVERRGRSYFGVWDGDLASLATHVT
jgi:hypothetical protein